MKNSNSNRRLTKIPFSLRLLRLIYNTFGRAFPNYFGNKAYDLWFTTIRLNTPKNEVSALKLSKKESIIVNELEVATYIWQHKTIKPTATLLFVHGFSGRGTQIANYTERLTAMGYRVISFDSAAHGNTPGKQTSVLEMTDIVLAMNKQYGDFDAAITHSFGGMALTFAMTRGLNLNKAALVAPPNNFDNIVDAFQQMIQLPDSVLRIMKRKGFATHGQVTRDLLDMKNNVKNLSCKGLIIHCIDDSDFPWQDSKATADEWSGAKFITTNGLGHRRIIRDQQVVQHVIDFLELNNP